MTKWITIGIASAAAGVGFIAGKYSGEIANGTKVAAGACADAAKVTGKACAKAVKACVPTRKADKDAAETAVSAEIDQTINKFKTIIVGEEG